MEVLTRAVAKFIYPYEAVDNVAVGTGSIAFYCQSASGRYRSVVLEFELIGTRLGQDFEGLGTRA